MHHLIVNQSDPTRHVLGGIPGFVADFVRYAPESHVFSIVGVTTSGDRPLGRWADAVVGNRTVDFMPVARLDAADQRRKIPHSARFIAGIARYRPRVDGVLVHSHRAEVGAALTLLFRNEPHVQFIHGDARAALAHKSETFWRFLPRSYGRIESLAVARSDLTVVMSSSAYERLRKESDNVALGRNWYDASCFSPGDSSEQVEFRIGWAGRLEPPKNPLLAVAALLALRSQGVHFSAWIAGAGTLASTVRQAVREAGLHDQVELTGTLTPDELATKLRHTTVFLMTSTWEGFPRAAVEALACGVPVVSTDVGEMRTLVEEGVTGHLSPTADASDLARLVLASSHLPRGRAICDTVAHLEARKVIGELLGQLPSATPETS